MTTPSSSVQPPGSRLLSGRMRALQLLALATLVTAAAAILARWWDQSSVEPAFVPTRLFPSLSAQLNDVATMTIVSKDSSFTIARSQGGRWVLPGKDNFLADRELIQATLFALAETDLVDARTKRADWHKRLELDDPKAGGAGRILILKNGAGAILAEVVIGKGVEGANVGDRFAAYVRKVGEDQTYVALGKMRLLANQSAWLNKKLIDFDRQQVREAAIKPAKGPAYAVRRAKPADDDFVLLTPLPPGRQLRTEREPNGVGQALFNLSFDDVVRATTLDFRNATFAGFEAFNGLRLSFAIIKKDEDFWATVQAVANPVPAPKPEVGQPLPMTAEAEARLLNEVAAGWAFKLPKFKGVLMTSPLEDLLKPVGGPPTGPSVPVPR